MLSLLAPLVLLLICSSDPASNLEMFLDFWNSWDCDGDVTIEDGSGPFNLTHQITVPSGGRTCKQQQQHSRATCKQQQQQQQLAYEPRSRVVSLSLT